MTLLDAPPIAEPHAADDAAGLIEPEDMHLYDDGPLYELVDGRLVEKHMSAYAQLATRSFDHGLAGWANTSNAGLTFVEATFLMFADLPRTVRRPDVAFVSASKCDAYHWDDPHIRLVPDLVVEVVSTNDTWREVIDKVGQYHAAGVPMVWIADPMERTLIVRPNPSAGAKPVVLTADDEIAGVDVLPGFRCRVGDLFPKRPAPPRPELPSDV